MSKSTELKMHKILDNPNRYFQKPAQLLIDIYSSPNFRVMLNFNVTKQINQF